MAWFKKEKKPRQPRRERLEIPADAWEKCEACGHTDIREKFWRNLNVCPNCEYHRRIRANDYANLLLDEGTQEELEVDLRSTDARRAASVRAMHRDPALAGMRVLVVDDDLGVCQSLRDLLTQVRAGPRG